MRLISQEGKIDVSYEMGSLTVSGGMITYYDYSCQKGTAMAIYHSEQKAMKVMQLIQNQYLDFCCNYHAQSGVFRFPKDSEVEV